jgi:glycosyltransferase involved in cell wall biosynthesis
MSFQLYGWPTLLDYKECSTKEIINPDGLKLSIVIPTLNQSETLEHTLLSIIHQDYWNYEILIIDGGSVDSTMSIVDKYQDWISVCITGKDSGQSNAINLGFNQASGDIYAWINSDDYYLPFAFSRIVRTFEKYNDVDIIVGSGDVISKDMKFLKHITSMNLSHENLIKWLDGFWIMQQSCFWTARIWRSIDGVDENLKLLMDLDLWFRFSKTATSIAINESIAAMRYYPEIKTISLKDYVKEESAYVLAKNGELSALKNMISELAIKNKSLALENAKLQNSSFKRLFKILGKYT